MTLLKKTLLIKERELADFLDYVARGVRSDEGRHRKLPSDPIHAVSRVSIELSDAIRAAHDCMECGSSTMYVVGALTKTIVTATRARFMMCKMSDFQFKKDENVLAAGNTLSDKVFQDKDEFALRNERVPESELVPENGLVMESSFDFSTETPITVNFIEGRHSGAVYRGDVCLFEFFLVDGSMKDVVEAYEFWNKFKVDRPIEETS